MLLPLVFAALLLPFAFLPSPARVLAWGVNSHGQLADGTTVERASPVAARLPRDATAVSGGGDFALALTADGRVLAWGSRREGMLADGTSERSDRLVPAPIEGLADVVAVSAGYFHGLALRRDGTVWSWGDGSYGQLGYTPTERCEDVLPCATRPRRVEGLPEIVAIAAAFHHSLALDREGGVWAWGSGRQGQVGDGTEDESPTPRRARMPVPAVAISAGGSQSLALGRDGTVWNWGAVDAQRTYVLAPRRVGSLSGVLAISAGEHHSLALTEDGRVWAWGDDEFAQLGIANLGTNPDPAPVPGLGGVSAIAAGTNHNAALTPDGAVWTWGWNAMGQLGDGTRVTRAEPARVEGLPSVQALGVGAEQVFVLLR